MRTNLYKILKFNCIKKTRIYFESTGLMYSPFQSYQFLKRIGLGVNSRKPFLWLKFKRRIWIVEKNSRIMLICPFYFNSTQKEIVLFGEVSSATNLDVIYHKEASVFDYEYLFIELRKEFPNYKFYFNRIRFDSLTYELLCKMKNTKIYRYDICVSIPFGSYDSWYTGLSKSTKQNIRTSYNRLKRDKIDFVFQCYHKKLPTKKILADMNRLFSRRICDHLNINSKLFKYALTFEKKINPMSRALKIEENFLGATIYIDNQLIAFFQGVIKDGRATIVRLSVNIDYAKYSPGGLLINEFLRYCDNNIFISEFDLARGDEKYKYTYGGMEYFNYGFCISLVGD